MDNLKRRNLAATSPLMKKGGVHDKSNKAKRKKDKQSLKRTIRAEQFGPYYFLGALCETQGKNSSTLPIN